MSAASCIFCAIAAGQAPAHVVWQSATHIAFLSIFPNTEGVTVVIPREHQPSYALALPDDVLLPLMQATKEVAAKIDRAFAGDVGRCAMVFEGFGVDHVHAKLFPLHGTAGSWQARHDERMTEYHPTYRGYVSSHDAARADDAALAATAERIRAA